MAEVVVAGAGIVGLATAYELTRRGHAVTVLEKEPEIARHQTGRNSGVIHSGLYYTPGSLKAKLGTAGAASMRDFAREHGIPVDICGKLVVATRPEQIASLWTGCTSAARPTAYRCVGSIRTRRASSSRTSPASPGFGWSRPASSTTSASVGPWRRWSPRAAGSC